MDNLYRGAAEASSGFAFNEEVLKKALANIYSKDFHPMTDIERNLFNAVWETMNDAMDEGFGKVEASDHDRDFLRALKENNAVFAAFKVHRTQKDMARFLTDSNGNLKPFEQWANEVQPIADHQMHHWLRTEYDTAVIRAHHAADWQQFLREKDIFPNLKWVQSTSIHPGADHKIFWNTVLPIEHPFWDEHRPGDRWNCKCDLISTDEEQTDIPNTEEPADEPQRGLKSNPGKDGIIFSDNHPYFPTDCKHCAFYKPTMTDKLKTIFVNRAKDCYNCPYIKGCIERIAEIKKDKERVLEERKRLMDSPEMPVREELFILPNLETDRLYLNNKPLKRLLNHCQSYREIEAAVYIWNNPEALEFMKPSPMGEGKDLTLPEVQKNIRKKKKRGITHYNVYRFKFKGSLWIIKLEVHKNEFEQPYFIREL